MHRRAIRPSAMHRCVLPELCSCVAAVLCTGVLSAIRPNATCPPRAMLRRSGALRLVLCTCVVCSVSVLDAIRPNAPCLPKAMLPCSSGAMHLSGALYGICYVPAPPVHSGAMRPGAMHRCPSALIRPNATCPPRGARLELCSCAAGALCALVLCTCIKRRYTPRRYAPACWALYAPTLHACTVVCSKLHNGAMRPGDQVLCTFVSVRFPPSTLYVPPLRSYAPA